MKKPKTLALPEFINHVRGILERKGVTQVEAARRIGVSDSLVSRALNPEHPRPSPDVVVRIAREIGGEEWGEECVFRRHG